MVISGRLIVHAPVATVRATAIAAISIALVTIGIVVAGVYLTCCVLRTHTHAQTHCFRIVLPRPLESANALGQCSRRQGSNHCGHFR